MEGVTIIASISPCKSKIMIRRLVKVKKILEDNLSMRLNLVITESNDGKNIMFLNDDVIELDDSIDVAKIVDVIIERLGIRQFTLPLDNVAVGASFNSE